MLELHIIRNETERVKKALEKRGFNKPQLIDQVIELDEHRRKIQFELDQLLARSNKASKEIGGLFKQGKQAEANELKKQVQEWKEKNKELQDELRLAKENLDNALIQIPNVPHELVPAGTSESDNEIYKDWEADLPELGENAQPHWELAKKYQLIDFELGVKITGAGFPVFMGKGARLQRALINFFLDRATGAGYKEIMPPLLVNEDSARGTGQIPDKEGQMYHATEDDLYLIPTAEVPITNIYRDVILSEDDFPVKMCGYTPCFRREAGSYGKDVRGLNRVHQFEKVEIVHLQHPDKSYDTLYEMLKHVESLLQDLKLPYRILRLCGGDLGFTSALTYDFEVYSAAQKKWLEVSSVSNFQSFQANRMKLRFRGKDKKTHLAHTLNGSALALARIVACLLENNQTEEGIDLPEVLWPYTGFQKI